MSKKKSKYLKIWQKARVVFKKYAENRIEKYVGDADSVFVVYRILNMINDIFCK